MRKKFDIYYPQNHHDQSKAGKKYKPSGNKVVVMTNKGIFLIVDSDGWYKSVNTLANEIGNYDVVWKE